MARVRARVCLIAPEFIGPFPNGGVGTACYWEARTLAAAGYDVTVLYTGPTERASAEHWERTYSDGTLTYIDLWRWASRKEMSHERVDLACSDAWTAELVLRFLRTQAFDLLLFQEFLGHGLRALQMRRSGEPLAQAAAVTLHSCRQWIYQGMRRLPYAREDMHVDFFERESARLADSVVAPSHHMAAWAVEHWRLQPDAVVPYCYDESIEGRATTVEHRGPFTQLVFFGRLETRKGLHLLCRALADHHEARGAIRTVTFLGKASTVEGRPSEAFISATLADLCGIDVRIISDMGSMEALAWLEVQRDTIVVAPSIVDNLPYAVIELFARRLPLISTRVGGIPEIVGRANEHVLADPTPDGVARVLAEVHQRAALTIDYRGGYSIKSSNAAHVSWVESLLATMPSARRNTVANRNIVFVDAREDALPLLGSGFVASDPSAESSRFLTWRQWRSSADHEATLFVSSDVRPHPGMTARFKVALAQPSVAAVTSYYARETAKGSIAATPLGASLEAGWAENVFGGACFAAQGDALAVLRQALPSEFHFWPAYAAMACANLELAMIPETLFAGAPAEESIDAIEAVINLYRTHAPERLDIGWVLKHAAARGDNYARLKSGGAAPGRAVYERFVQAADVEVAAFAGLQPTAGIDPHVREMRKLRERLAALAAQWAQSCPRVFVYGAGEHARLVLMLEPELGRHIAGFIDRRPLGEFLGKPCVRPEDVSPQTVDVVLYSSREHEREMHRRLAKVDVRHVLLYADSPVQPEDTTATRLRRRFGHAHAATAELRDMYHPPAWVQGGCSGGDAEFLLEMVAAFNPRVVLELGVASGTSSAALLFSLDQLPEGEADRLLYSGDVRRTCYFDPSRATGAAVHDMYPKHRTTWLLDTDTDARRVRQTLPVGCVDFTFIDANHSHPWPLLDLLHISTLVRPESWIALHDVELPRLYPQFQVHGPQWLFEAWPFNKIHGVEGSMNIGAVQLPADLERLVPMALDLLRRPWEHAPTTWDVQLPEIYGAVSEYVTPRLAVPAHAVLAG